MPRKLRVPKMRLDQAISPALCWWLMCGRDVDPSEHIGRYRFRLPGWFEWLQLETALRHRDVCNPQDVAASVPPETAATIIEEAKSHGFRAWLETGQTPSGSAFDRWRSAFLDAHLY